MCLIDRVRWSGSYDMFHKAFIGVTHIPRQSENLTHWWCCTWMFTRKIAEVIVKQTKTTTTTTTTITYRNSQTHSSPILMSEICGRGRSTVYKDGLHDSFPKLKSNHLDRPLVAGCSTDHKPLPKAHGSTLIPEYFFTMGARGDVSSIFKVIVLNAQQIIHRT